MSDLKRAVAAIPGSLVVHRLVKNFRRYLGSKRPTVGGIRRADMTVADAVVYTGKIFTKIDDFVAGTLAACRRLLRPGGVMLHEVDLRSHQTYEKHALQFLEYPSWLWRLMSSHNGEPNRVRMPAYLKISSELGFDEIETTIVESFPDELIAAVRPKLASEFQTLSDDDLSPAIFVLGCTVLACSGSGG